MKHGIGLGIVAIFLLVFHSAAHAALVADVSYTATPKAGSPGVYTYNVSLTNTGDTNISTYWFGWIDFNYPPYYDYIYDLLTALPTNVKTPIGSGWQGHALNDSPFGGYSVEFNTFTAPLAPGHTLSGLTFDSTDTPDHMSGPSDYYYGYYSSDTSYVYIGASQADAGALIQPVQKVPEPTMGLFGVACGTLLLRQRRAV
jgi:hypothetical protein